MCGVLCCDSRIFHGYVWPLARVLEIQHLAFTVLCGIPAMGFDCDASDPDALLPVVPKNKALDQGHRIRSYRGVHYRASFRMDRVISADNLAALLFATNLFCDIHGRILVLHKNNEGETNQTSKTDSLKTALFIKRIVFRRHSNHKKFKTHSIHTIFDRKRAQFEINIIRQNNILILSAKIHRIIYSVFLIIKKSILI